uniref:Uncharacterized protein n=1 Tax=Solanum tuberosum TaxID=4113 RepID=M1CSG2_SOLTU
MVERSTRRVMRKCCWIPTPSEALTSHPPSTTEASDDEHGEEAIDVTAGEEKALKALRKGLNRVNRLLLAHAQGSNDDVAAMRRGRCINRLGLESEEERKKRRRRRRRRREERGRSSKFRQDHRGFSSGVIPIKVSAELRKSGQGFAWGQHGLRVPVPPRV